MIVRKDVEYKSKRIPGRTSIIVMVNTYWFLFIPVYRSEFYVQKI